MIRLPCHRCGPRGDIRTEPCDAGAAYGYIVYCNNCSGGEFEVSHGWTEGEARAAWNDAVQERSGDEDAATPNT